MMIEEISRVMEDYGIHENSMENVDSVVYVSFLLELENKYKIEFPDEYITLGAIGSAEQIYRIIKDIKECAVVQATT